MSRRLDVFLEDEELMQIEQIAQLQQMTVTEWVRHILRVARRPESLGDVNKKLAAVETASQYAFPIGDIDEVLADIDRGYSNSLP